MRRVKIIILSVGMFYFGTINAGSLSFSASAYSVAENVSTLTITVNRTGSTAAAATTSRRRSRHSSRLRRHQLLTELA